MEKSGLAAPDRFFSSCWASFPGGNDSFSHGNERIPHGNDSIPHRNVPKTHVGVWKPIRSGPERHGNYKSEPPLSQLFLDQWWRVHCSIIFQLDDARPADNFRLPQNVRHAWRRAVRRRLSRQCRGPLVSRSVWQKRRRQQHRRDAGHNLPPRIHDQAGDVAGRYDARR